MTTNLITFNRFKSTSIYGTFSNVDSSNGNILADGKFQRNLTIEGNLILGLETIDSSGNATDTGGTIQFILNKVPYSIPLTKLSYLINVTSDIQQQISNITSNGSSISNLGYITQTLSDITSTQFGTNAYNKTLLSTTSLYNSAFGGNVLYNNTTGNFNTCVGHSSGFANTTGSCLTAIGQQALAKNTSGNYNTAVGFLSSTDNITGSANTSMGSYSLLHNTIGSYNTSIGFFSATENTTGSSNSSFGNDTLRNNTTGNNNSAFGYHALRNNTTGYNNTSLGSASGQSMITTIGSTCIGTNSDTSYNYSTAIGYNSVCTSQNQLTLGTSSDSVVVPGNLSVTGTINNISSDIFSKIQYLNTVSSNIQTQISNVANNKTFNSGLSASDITFTGSINNISNTVFGYLSNVSSDIQSQINTVSSSIANIGNNPLVLNSTLNVSGLSTLTQVQVNTSLSVLQNISFIGTLNNISANTFSYLNGLTSNIQTQINNLNNANPVGSVISYAGTSASLIGYLPCDGTQYFLYEYPALFSVIQYTYGGDESTGRFKVPNYNGIFLRGSGNQPVNLRVIPGRGAVVRVYSSQSLGTVVPHENEEIITANYISQINQDVKSFVTEPNGFGPPGYSFNYSNAVASLNYDTSHDTINPGNAETFPVYTSIQYFIKY